MIEQKHVNGNYECISYVQEARRLNMLRHGEIKKDTNRISRDESYD